MISALPESVRSTITGAINTLAGNPKLERIKLSAVVRPADEKSCHSDVLRPKRARHNLTDKLFIRLGLTPVPCHYVERSTS